jgi:hypothetical protein
MTYTGTKWADRLNYLATIEDGWYWKGEGEAVLPATLDRADEILRLLDSPNFNVPGIYAMVEDGGIGMEWAEIGQPHLVSIEFNKNFAYEVFAMDSTGAIVDDILLETNSFEEAMEMLRECLTKSRLLTRCATRD